MSKSSSGYLRLVNTTRTVTVKVKDTQLVEILGIVFPEMRCLILEERIVLIPERRQTHPDTADADTPGLLPPGDTSRLRTPRPIYNILKEAIVVGYGIQQKKNVTGAVSVLDEKDIKDRPVAGIGQVMQGMVSNLNILQESGQPGAVSLFNIRGTTSLNGGDPLILVDGVETDPMSVNPSDSAMMKNAELFSGYIKDLTGIRLNTKQNQDRNVIKLRSELPDSCSEAYDIRVYTDSIVVNGASPAGSSAASSRARQPTPCAKKSCRRCRYGASSMVMYRPTGRSSCRACSRSVRCMCVRA